MKLNGKACIVTGSAQGLGKEFSRRLLLAGGRVIISDLQEEVGNNTVKEFRKEFGEDRAHFVRCDVTNNEDLDNLIEASNKVFGAPVDIFVNNAGINLNKGWEMCMKVNIMAVMTATEKALAAMQNREGCKIINIASVAGLATGLGASAMSYHVSKHGVVSMSRTMATAKKNHGVDFLCLCPSWADTDIINKSQNRNETEKKRFDKVLKTMGVLEVDKVGDGFAKLLESKNGTVIACMYNTPPFEVADHGMPSVLAYTGASKVFALAGMGVVRKWHLAVFYLLLFYILHYILGFIGL